MSVCDGEPWTYIPMPMMGVLGSVHMASPISFITPLWVPPVRNHAFLMRVVFHSPSVIRRSSDGGRSKLSAPPVMLKSRLQAMMRHWGPSNAHTLVADTAGPSAA